MWFTRLIFLSILSIAILAQPVTIQQAVAEALRHYPVTRVTDAEVRKAAAGIQLARTAYLPKFDVIAGVNRATRNNVLGLLVANQVIAPISGPVLNTNSLDSVWGSTVGVLATWEPFDFGLRHAKVNVAGAGKNRAEAALARTQLDVATLAADSFLTIIAAQQTVIAADAAVKRADELRRITDALVQAELRPGAESSLARAEQASAQAQLIRARQAVAEAKASLAALLGVEPKNLALESARFLTVPSALSAETSLDENPVLKEQGSVVAESQARLRVLDKSYLPHFALQGTSYARGTGALPDGRLLGGANGLGPNIQNWGIGFTATFPVFDLPSIRAHRNIETAQLDAERSRLDQIRIDLKAKRDRAEAAYEGAQQVAATTPVAIEAGRAAIEQARARYQSGLGTALEVADAQRRLAQAEIDDSLARLNIWRARLMFYAVQGDISPLLTEASR